MAFPLFFCTWIEILFHDLSTVIDVNGCLPEPIQLQRSIRQGCPIAPSLFVIAADALFYILRASEFGPPVKRIRLPDNSSLLNAQFADDTALFSELSEANSDYVLERSEFFRLASGAKVAPQKSTVIGWSEKPPSWLVEKGWGWAGPSKVVRYLGIPFSISPSLKDMWEWIFAKVEKKHHRWQTHLLSLAGRV